MDKNEEEFVHFVSCIQWLNNCWCLLQLIKDQKNNPLVGSSFRFALIEYSKPYTKSYGKHKPHILDNSYVPVDFKALHETILISRKKIHAHFDLGLLEAKLYFHEIQGQRFYGIVQNQITGLEELPKINEIIKLVEGTLENMYEKENKLLELWNTE